MKTFHCDACGQQVFFENTYCQNCGHRLGWLAARGEMLAFADSSAPEWLAVGEGGRCKPCRNYALEQVCNGVLAADDPQVLCPCCRLTRLIPDLSVAGNRARWYALERAKRRLYYSLARLGLPLTSRQEDPQRGLAFEFKASPLDGAPVHTGHANGVITLNIAEADDAYRERLRTQMGESYRTLLGHFRHESGHYYFMRLMLGSPLLPACRALFGDERADYAQALQRHYQEGPPSDWAQRHISAYASMHPCEDWAESWAHYLHMVDTLETARACGLSLQPQDPTEPVLAMARGEVVSASFQTLIGDWFALTYVLNSLNRSLGQPDGYPFTLASPVIDKLRFMHHLIHGAAGQG